MDSITVDPTLVADCGLYCGACGAYRKGRCPGCRKNAKATWCKVRVCGIEHGYSTCANCATHADPRRCRTYHNFISRLFGFVFRSTRAAGIDRIRTVGTEAFAREMAAARRHSLPR